MKLYYLSPEDWHLIPFDYYKDKFVILVRNSALNKPLSYQIIRDYTFYCQANALALMVVLFNLTPEDFTHLNLLGITIKPDEDYRNKNLKHAINKNIPSISYESLFMSNI